MFDAIADRGADGRSGGLLRIWPVRVTASQAGHCFQDREKAQSDVIISASYKTDIPAFFGEWFINRLEQGFCKMLNPYNRRPIRVSLRREDVDGFVFWTKNLNPFLKHLDKVAHRDFPFVVQYTINGYPRALEHSVVDATKSMQAARHVSDNFGPDACVWRYDTIVATSLTSFDFHRKNFERLAAQLTGVTNEVVISFAHFYRKTLRNMQSASDTLGFSWNDPADEEKRNLVAELAAIANACGIQLTVCSQPQFVVEGSKEARCVDADRFERINGKALRARLRGNRKQCGCFESRDIGEYDTCPHGCVYCYAVQHPDIAAKRFKEHNPNSEFLHDPGIADDGAPPALQLPLFPGNPSA